MSAPTVRNVSATPAPTAHTSAVKSVLVVDQGMDLTSMVTLRLLTISFPQHHPLWSETEALVKEKALHSPPWSVRDRILLP